MHTAELLSASRPRATTWSDLFLLIGFALGLRLLFAVLIRDTYDYDEFVVLLLGRDFAHGLVPYREFMFFHPPGILVLLRFLQPLLSQWWPAGRVLMALLDTATVALVWAIGRRLYDARAALIAGALYAVSPLALISAVRIGQDPVITLLVTGGIALLVLHDSRWATISAGVCLGLAVWFKYPAAAYIPVYILVAPRRTALWLPAAAATIGLALLWFFPEWSQFYRDTVTFQRTRWVMLPAQRWETVALYWLVFNALALPALLLVKRPVWLAAGFLIGLVFIAGSQVYYHYFTPVVPFAALLAAPLLARIRWASWPAVAASGTLAACLWAAVIDLGGESPLYITAARLSAIHPTVALLDRRTPPGSAVLADRYEYAYLANRQALAHYFWNVGVLVNARYLERRLSGARAVVMSYGASSGYPAGFTAYLNARYPRTHTRVTDVWILKW